MKFASWNVRGLNKSPHQKELVNFILANQISFMEIMETKVKIVNACAVAKKISRNWKWSFNYEHHYNGRVWVGWDPNLWDIVEHSKSSQHISCQATFLEKNIVFLITFVYAFNDAADRLHLWDNICSLSTTTTPWCLMGISTAFLVWMKFLGVENTGLLTCSPLKIV